MSCRASRAAAALNCAAEVELLQCALLGDAAGSFQAATAKRAMADAGEAQARRVKDKKAKKKKAKKASKSAQSPSDRGTKRRREGACLRKLALFPRAAGSQSLCTGPCRCTRRPSHIRRKVCAERGQG